MSMSRRDRFVQFHRANPHVYLKLRELALSAKAAGLQRLGIRMLWERLRWHYNVEVRRNGDDFKLNDHYTRFYARLLMHHEPALRDFFETRDRQEAHESVRVGK